MPKDGMRAGMIGCGTIGSELAQYLRRHPGFSLHTLCDALPDRAQRLARRWRTAAPGITDLAGTLRRNQVIVEAAGPGVVRELLSFPARRLQGKRILILSTGGLIHSLRKMHRLRETEFFIPSGAVAGLDAIRAVRGEIRSLTLTTTKPAGSLATAPFVNRNNLQLDRLATPQVIFEGGLEEAVEGFPVNINVAASLFLASRFRGLVVRIIADPATPFNSHEVQCEGDFGIIHTRTQNRPSANPKTSRLAILSARSVLDRMAGNIR
jgi:aspartate dehydrogenase